MRVKTPEYRACWSILSILDKRIFRVSIYQADPFVDLILNNDVDSQFNSHRSRPAACAYVVSTWA